MTISTEEVWLLNNKMGSIARKVQLGTLIQNAESVVAAEIALAEGKVLIGNASGLAEAQTLSGDVTVTSGGVAAIGTGVVVNTDISASAAIAFSKLAALTDGYILVGSGSNVATAVAMSGDVTIANTGATTIGAAKVTEAMLKAANTVGLGAKRTCYAVFDPSAVAGDRTIAAHALGTAIPTNAFVTGVWYWVETTCTSATDAATIAIHIEGANDVVTAIAISDGANAWDTTGTPVEGTTKIETTSTWLKTTGARQITATVAVEALTAGKVHIWAEYIAF